MAEDYTNSTQKINVKAVVTVFLCGCTNHCNLHSKAQGSLKHQVNLDLGLSLVDANSDTGHTQRYAGSANPEVVSPDCLSVCMSSALARGHGC
jgi:hypothetical protein